MVKSNRRVGSLRLALLAAGLALLATLDALAAEVTATLDRRMVVEGETVTLLLQTDDPQQSLETDLDRLATNFHIIDQRSETQMSIVNGRQTAVVRLLVTLEPKRTGRITIPSLAFRGGSSTQPMTLMVEPAPEPAPGELPPVFIEVEVDPQEGPYYVHAQLSLKVRIFYQQNLTEAAINPPMPQQASVRLLDEVPYQADRNGERYRVLERRYAVFPERSGELSIPPLQLTGRLIERPADRLWQPSVRGRRVRIESDPVVLEISPRPPEFTGDSWMPARAVDLAQQITDGDSVTVGEPVTRTIILDAVGLEEHMLEEPAWPELAQARIYPDQPQGISRDDGQWVLGHREYRYAVVPEAPGELVLPEIRLPWWDTVNHRERVAILPEHRVTVLPSPIPEAPSERVESQAGPDAPMLPELGGAEARPWQWLSLALAIGWVGTLLLFLLRRSAGPERTGPAEADTGGKALRRAVKRACEANDARGAHAALGRWLRHQGPASAAGSLMDFARQVGDDALGMEIRRLDAAAYGTTPTGGWTGVGLWGAFEAWRKAGKGAGRERPAEDLDLYAASRGGVGGVSR